MENFLISLAVFIRIISNSFSNVFQKKVAEMNVSPYFINFVTYLLLFIFCLPLCFFIEVELLSFDFWIYAILGGIFGAVGNSFLIKALEHGELSVLGPINAYKSVVGLLGGILFLHEIPSPIGVLGIIFIILGSYFIFDTVDEKFSLKILRRKDIQYRFLALFFTAIEAVFIKKVIVETNILISCVSTCIFGALFSFIINGWRWEFLSKKSLKYLIFIAVAFTLVMITTAYVFYKLNVGYALSLFQLSILLNVFLGCKIFDEKHLLKKTAGAVIVILGSVAIILS